MEITGKLKRSTCNRATALMFVSVFGGVSAQTATVDGRAIFLDARKGNCAACHQVRGDPAVSGKSRLGPDLTGNNARFPDRSQLRAAIWDLSAKLPGTIMPPYGKHRILTEGEIDALVRYLEMY